MSIGQDRNNDRFANWKLCGVWKFPFCHHRVMKLTQIYVCFINPCHNLLVLSSVTCEYHPKVLYLNFSTCFSALPLTCSVHLLGFLDRHNILVLLVLNFTPVSSHAGENRSSTCWRPCWEHARNTKPPTKSKRLILQFPAGTLSSTQLYNCLSNSYRL